jgi:hypothetical protein
LEEVTEALWLREITQLYMETITLLSASEIMKEKVESNKASV